MQSKSPARTAALCLALLAAWALALANWDHPVLRFTDALANLLVLWLLLWLPWAAGGVALVRLRGRMRWLLFALSLGAMGFGLEPLLATSLGVALDRSDPNPTGLSPLQRFPLARRGELVVYDAGCGAPCGLDFQVRQEREILPGLLVVRVLYDGPELDEHSVEVISPDRVRIGRDTMRVRPWLYR